ncbi:MAG: hypothetical protein MUQ75_02780 [Crocinitomicaceae bacterium]|nr:hypothetical protein [Crocinitomicaceae bacterium]
MAKKNTEEIKKQVISINNRDYNASDLTDQQKVMVNHVYDLRGKIASAEFALEQLKFAEAAFSKELVASVELEPEEVETEEA